MKYQDTVPEVGQAQMRGEGRRKVARDLLVHERQLAGPVYQALQAGRQVQSISTERFAQEKGHQKSNNDPNDPGDRFGSKESLP
jgi:hypothetical protein